MFQSFVACSMGIWQVGYVMIPFGLANAIVSFTSGKLARYTGILPLVTLAFISDLAVQVVYIQLATLKAFYADIVHALHVKTLLQLH